MATTWTTDELTAPPPGFRLALVRACPSIFAGCRRDRRTYSFVYPADKRFNVSAPEPRLKYMTFYDVVPEPIDGPSEPLTPEEAEFLPKLRRGFSAERHSKFWPTPEGVRRSLYRLNWLTAVTEVGLLVHPQLDRCLTAPELEAVDAGRPPLEAWLDEQARLCDEDAWGDEDWESSYDRRSGEWYGRDTPGLPVKRFDLCELAGASFELSEYPSCLRRRL